MIISFLCPLGFLLLKIVDNNFNSSLLSIPFSVCSSLLPQLSSFQAWEYYISASLLVMKLFFNSDNILCLSQALAYHFCHTVT